MKTVKNLLNFSFYALLTGSALPCCAVKIAPEPRKAVNPEAPEHEQIFEASTEEEKEEETAESSRTEISKLTKQPSLQKNHKKKGCWHCFDKFLKAFVKAQSWDNAHHNGW